MPLGRNVAPCRAMVTISDIQRREAVCELLSMPDPFDALRRHRLVLEGRPDRYDQIPQITAVYVQTKLSGLRDRAALRADAPALNRVSPPITTPLTIRAWKTVTASLIAATHEFASRVATVRSPVVALRRDNNCECPVAPRSVQACRSL